MSSSGDEKCSSVNEDVSCVESVTNIASIVGDNESILVSYATMNTERMEKESDKISMKGNPVCFYDFNQFSTLLATKKTTNESNPMNLKRYIDHYNISVNKILSLESVFGRRKIHLQGKEMTLISDGKMNNCDKDIFVIEEFTRTHSICSLLSAKNKAPILSKLSFIHPELIGTQKKRAFLLDLAFLHFKKKCRCGALSTMPSAVKTSMKLLGRNPVGTMKSKRTTKFGNVHGRRDPFLA